MLKKTILAAAALASTAGALSAPADAQRYYGGDRYYHGRAYDSAYDDGYNRGPRYYRDDRGYYRNSRSRGCSGTTGTIVGAIAGGLLGRTIDTRGDRTLGTVLGGAAGALAGNAVEKGGNRYCR